MKATTQRDAQKLVDSLNEMFLESELVSVYRRENPMNGIMKTRVAFLGATVDEIGYTIRLEGHEEHFPYNDNAQSYVLSNCAILRKVTDGVYTELVLSRS